ncbi:MAG: signal peptidase II [Actinobacteria bacterium]|nr:signal peptidase II [Actinomycetota bacterium]
MTSALFVVAVAALTVAVDVAAKRVVVARLAEGRLYGAHGVGFRRTHNRGAASSRLPLRHAMAAWAALAVVLTWAAATRPSASPLVATGFGLAIGGAAGNLVDRVRSAAIVDFVAAGPWPVFNLADAAMVAGVVLAVGALV